MQTSDESKKNINYGIMIPNSPNKCNENHLGNSKENTHEILGVKGLNGDLLYCND